MCQGDENPAVSKKVYADIAKLLDPGKTLLVDETLIMALGSR